MPNNSKQNELRERIVPGERVVVREAGMKKGGQNTWPSKTPRPSRPGHPSGQSDKNSTVSS